MDAKLLNGLRSNPIRAMDRMTDDDIAAVITAANHAYHNHDAPVFSDQLYDIIREYLEERNPNHQVLKDVGATATAAGTGKKTALPIWMGSMTKIKSEDGALRRWKDVFANGSVVVSDKLDGISALFVPASMRMYTRGDGSVGHDISHLIPFIASIPQRDPAMQRHAMVRGELIIPKRDFDRVKHLGKNARNMVAGLVNAKRPDMHLVGLVHFVAYENVVSRTSYSAASSSLGVLEDFGFEVVHHSEMGIGSVSTESLSQILEKRRKASPYEMDGIIVSHDATHPRLREENPKHAFAFKSMAFMDKAEVVVTGVEWNVSKDGYFKPVVLFDGVDLAGVTVRRATGHNARYIVDQRIGPGARIVVVRSGDVIPYITEVLQGADASEERDLLPTGGAWNDTMVDVIVGSGRVTDGVLDEIAFKNIVYFFEKIGAVGVGAGVLKKIYSDGGSKTVGRMIALDKAHVSGIEGFQDRSAANFVDEIQKALAKADIVSLMCATNAFGRGIGTKTLTVVLKAFPSFGALRTQPPPMQALIQIGGIEEKTAVGLLNGVVKWREFVRNNGMVDLVESKTEEWSSSSSVAKPAGALVGCSFVFTGVRDKALEEYIVANGGAIRTSVSKNTTALVSDSVDGKTQKVKDATKFGVPVFSMEAFATMYASSFDDHKINP